ncbi:hypothetical protein KKI24_29915 [bacterium]|nr:hypothetical protein [bacterium]
MFPGIFEWVWDMGHVIFMGLFWLVIITLFSGIFYVLAKTVMETGRNGDGTRDAPNRRRSERAH